MTSPEKPQPKDNAPDTYEMPVPGLERVPEKGPPASDIINIIQPGKSTEEFLRHQEKKKCPDKPTYAN